MTTLGVEAVFVHTGLTTHVPVQGLLTGPYRADEMVHVCNASRYIIMYNNYGYPPPPSYVPSNEDYTGCECAKCG